MKRPQSVAEHSYRVAAIAMQIGAELGSMPVVNIAAVQALAHDVDEAETGDIPSHLKDPDQWDSTPRPITDYIVKLADLIEAFTYLGHYGEATSRRMRILENYRESIVGWMRLMEGKFPTAAKIGSIVDDVLAVLAEAK